MFQENGNMKILKWKEGKESNMILLVQSRPTAKITCTHSSRDKQNSPTRCGDRTGIRSCVLPPTQSPYSHSQATLQPPPGPTQQSTITKLL